MPDFARLRTTMVDTQVRPSDVTKYPIIEAMLTVPRENFVPDNKRDAAYVGGDVELGDSRVVLDPRVLSKMLDALEISKSDLVLDIGCGLGYSSAVIAHLAQAVIALEEDEALAGEAERALSEANADNVVVEKGTLTDGAAQHGPYDVILFQGAVEAIPQAILDQLKEDGRICAVFIEDKLGTVRLGQKIGGDISWRMVFNATAPLLPGFAAAQEFAL